MLLLLLADVGLSVGFISWFFVTNGEPLLLLCWLFGWVLYCPPVWLLSVCLPPCLCWFGACWGASGFHERNTPQQRWKIVATAVPGMCVIFMPCMLLSFEPAHTRCLVVACCVFTRAACGCVESVAGRQSATTVTPPPPSNPPPLNKTRGLSVIIKTKTNVLMVYFFILFDNFSRGGYSSSRVIIVKNMTMIIKLLFSFLVSLW